MIKTLTSTPRWLPLVNNLSYIGVSLGDLIGQTDMESRSNEAKKSLYCLQGAGLNPLGCFPKLLLHAFGLEPASISVYRTSSGFTKIY